MTGDPVGVRNCGDAALDGRDLERLSQIDNPRLADLFNKRCR
jgi:hypothetical protein